MGCGVISDRNERSDTFTFLENIHLSSKYPHQETYSVRDCIKSGLSINSIYCTVAVLVAWCGYQFMGALIIGVRN